MSQQGLADAVGAAQSTIGSLESGARESSTMLALMATALDVDALWLSEGIGEPDRPSGAPDVVVADHPTPAAKRIMDLLQGRGEEEIDRIATALEVLLQGRKRATKPDRAAILADARAASERAKNLLLDREANSKGNKR
jgi:transcriptional regulator with XRE-family HTH domain